LLQIVFAGWGVPLATTPLDLWCTVIQFKIEELLGFIFTVAVCAPEQNLLFESFEHGALI
jgi:hypothetical protein